MNTTLIHPRIVSAGGLRLRRGFTIIELMMVIIILGMIAVLAVPMFSQAGELRLGEAAEQIATTIRYAQTAAITLQRPYQVVVDSAANTFELRDAADNLLTDTINQVGDWASANLFSINFTNHPRFANITLDSADFDASARLWFDQLGAPYSGPISDNSPLVEGSIVMRCGNDTVTIRIEPVTGNVVVIR